MCSDLQRRPQRIEEMTGALLARARVVVAVEERTLLGDHQGGLPNLLARAPQRLDDEVSADYNDMIYAASPVEIEQRRFALLRKWRLRCKAVADSLEEAGDRLFTFTRLPLS
jgi:hypothetical protein